MLAVPMLPPGEFSLDATPAAPLLAEGQSFLMWPGWQQPQHRPGEEAQVLPPPLLKSTLPRLPPPLPPGLRPQLPSRLPLAALKFGDLPGLFFNCNVSVAICWSVKLDCTRSLLSCASLLTSCGAVGAAACRQGLGRIGLLAGAKMIGLVWLLVSVLHLNQLGPVARP